MSLLESADADPLLHVAQGRKSHYHPVQGFASKGRPPAFGPRSRPSVSSYLAGRRGGDALPETGWVGISSAEVDETLILRCIVHPEVLGWQRRRRNAPRRFGIPCRDPVHPSSAQRTPRVQEMQTPVVIADGL